MVSGNVNFKAVDPSEILEPSSLQHYEESLGLIWRELVRLNSCLFVLDKLLEFPSTLFLDPGRETFLTLAKLSLFESSLLIISKLVTDPGPDVLTIRRFKNRVREQIKEEYRKSFDHHLKENRFDEIVNTLPKKDEIKRIRDNFVAHLIVDKNLQPKISEDVKISFPQVDAICKNLNSLFDVLCFGVEHLMLPLDYSPRVQHPVGSDPRSDIEYILDLIVQDSHFFKMPEESQYWDIERKGLSSKEIDILNKYRRKFGKPEV
jgi:hypothetical protein